jgi:hypothetical protein
MGGAHGDLALEDSAGEVIASAIVENKFSAVLDLSLFRKGQLIRFMVTFAETLYRLNGTALHLFVDEADAVAPQGRTFGGEENRMLGAMEDIVRRGRIRGIGCTLLTQRPAVLNKNVLTQCENLFLLRIVAPQDIKAFMEWVHLHSTQVPGLDASVETRPASPAPHVRQQRYPEARREGAPPKNVAEINLAALGEKIAATVQKAKDSDPRELRRRIGELEKQLCECPAKVERKIERVEVEVPVLRNGQLDKANRLVDRMVQLMNDAREIYSPLANAIARAGNAREPQHGHESTNRQSATPVHHPAGVNRPDRGHASEPVAKPRVRQDTARTQEAVAEGITGPQQRILDALAWLESVRVPQAKRTQLALLAEQSPTSSAFGNNLGALKNDKSVHPWPRLIDCPCPGLVCLTEAGRRAARSPDVPPTTAALHEALFARLPAPQTRILPALIAAYPAALDRQQLAEQTGQSATSSAYGNNLGALWSLGLIDYPGKGQVVAMPVLGGTNEPSVRYCCCSIQKRYSPGNSFQARTPKAVKGCRSSSTNLNNWERMPFSASWTSA